MSANHDKWHLVILVEDPAYADLAKGFKRLLPDKVRRQVEVNEPPGGGRIALYEQAKEMAAHIQDRQILLVLTDFDSKLTNVDDVRGDEDEDNASIDERCGEFDDIRRNDPSGRTFVIGPLMEAEHLVNELASMLPVVVRADVEATRSEVRCGGLFASNDLRCDDSLWGKRQLRHYYNQEQLRQLCALLQRTLMVDCA